MQADLRHCINYRMVKQTVSLLRKRHCEFLLVAVRTSGGRIAEMSSSVAGGEVKKVNNGLLLYYHQYSFYSQKVVMALHEKHLAFDSHIVNITKGEQYQPWFLKINPRGEVPVLQDTGKIIPDSARIIDYLEDNFSNGDTPRLIPMDEGPEVRQRVTYFRTMIEQLPASIITMGSFFHPELVDSPKIPFIAPVRRVLANGERNNSKMLREVAHKVLDAKVVLTEKAEFQDKKHQVVLNKDEYCKVLEQVEEVLMRVEEELSKHVGDKADWWLCSRCFSVADVALAILLERLYELGLEKRFWSEGKRPFVEKYFERVKQRDSFKKAVPHKLFIFKMIFLQNAPVYIGVSLGVAAAVIVGGYFLAKKYLL